MFKGLNGFGRLMNIFMCAAMCVVLCIIIPFVVEANLGVQGALNPASFLQSFVLSFCIAYPFGDLLPAVNWGGKLAASLHVKGVGAYLIQCLVTARAHHVHRFRGVVRQQLPRFGHGGDDRLLPHDLPRRSHRRFRGNRSLLGPLHETCDPFERLRSGGCYGRSAFRGLTLAG